MEANKRVKFMKRKITMMLCLCICILGLAACGTDPKSIDYNGMTYQELEDYAINTWEGLRDMDTAQMEAAVNQIEGMSEAEQIRLMEANEGMEEELLLIKSWLSVKSQAGEFVDVDSFHITTTGKTTTTELTLKFEKRPVMVTVVYQNRDMTVETVTVDLIYSTGEKMQKAAMNTVMGMGTVFIMLIIICLIISCFGVIPKIEKKRKEKKEQKEQAAVTETAAVPEPAPVPVVSVGTDDLELVAVIAAAVAAYTGQSEDDFIVRSIKRRS